MLGRILRYLAVAFCIAFVSSCMADEDSLLMDGDVPCTVKVAGIVADGTVMTPLSSVDVRLELYAPGASSAHSSVSTRTDDGGRYELRLFMTIRETDVSSPYQPAAILAYGTRNTKWK